MRATIHNGRSGKNGTYNPRHNDRNFDIGNAEHIDPERVNLNHYWNYLEDNSLTFEQAERAFYEEHCSKHLDAVNQRYREQRHPERVRSMDEYRTARQSCRKKQSSCLVINLTIYRHIYCNVSAMSLKHGKKQRFRGFM